MAAGTVAKLSDACYSGVAGALASFSSFCGEVASSFFGDAREESWVLSSLIGAAPPIYLLSVFTGRERFEISIILVLRSFGNLV